MPPKKKEADKKEEEEAKPIEDTGVFVFHANSRYSGQFVRRDGVVKRHGKGEFNDGFLSYNGEWADDKMHGAGELRFASGASYDGTLYEGTFDGRGKYCWPDGSWYEGQWRANRMHGEGVYSDAEGRQWEGRFYNGTGPGLKRQAIPPPVGAVAAKVNELAAAAAAQTPAGTPAPAA
uniref:MORN repeat-containing protein 5 n=1 Tax=Neobodo designis TaxID=312471 RepID=A0A7S1Q6S9_NEODS|mmetsp:Transcript_32938/g.101765  ORF Transcript_32938/g.101765 Transcript_32938/m.101765 type:complete len:177 (+) Transcript_32938:31-561(+)